MTSDRFHLVETLRLSAARIYGCDVSISLRCGSPDRAGLHYSSEGIHLELSDLPGDLSMLAAAVELMNLILFSEGYPQLKLSHPHPLAGDVLGLVTEPVIHHRLRTMGILLQGLNDFRLSVLAETFEKGMTNSDEDTLAPTLAVDIAKQLLVVDRSPALLSRYLTSLANNADAMRMARCIARRIEHLPLDVAGRSLALGLVAEELQDRDLMLSFAYPVSSQSS